MEKMSDACVAQWSTQATGIRKTWARIPAHWKASFFPQKDFKFFKVQDYLLIKKVAWNLKSTRSSHFGGLWAASVKSFDFHFTTVAGNLLLTYEQLHTYSLFHKERYAFTRKVLKKTSFIFFGTKVRIKH